MLCVAVFLSAPLFAIFRKFSYNLPADLDKILDVFSVSKDSGPPHCVQNLFFLLFLVSGNLHLHNFTDI